MSRKFNILFAVTLFMLAACSVEEQNVNMPENVPGKVAPKTEGVVEGELLVRFDPRVSEILDKAGVVTKSGRSAASRSGILSVDQVLDLVDGYQIERVFPVDIRTEDKTRHEGLHLWYVVRFSDEHPVEKVAADLAVLGEVSRVEYNRTLKRANSRKAVALTPEMVSAAMSSAAPATFDDPHLGLQWHLVNNGDLGSDVASGAHKFIAGADVNAAKAWELCQGDPSIIVAVLDEGVDYSHPDLKASMWVNEDEVWRGTEDNDGNGYAGDYYGYNFAAGNGVISTGGRYDTGHGTHVAGVIAATNDNNIGISSVAGGTAAQPGVKIMSCQIFSSSLAGTVLDEVKAIKYAADNGAVILQCSWGYISGAADPFEWTPQFSDDDQWKGANILEYKALDYFLHNAGSPDGVIDGGVIVFAAGNESAPAASYPAAYSDYISVGATAADYTPAVYTNYGMGTTISAPGGDQDYYYEYGSGLSAGHRGCVLSTLPYTVTGATGELAGYGYMEGTSMACPHVSGVVALGLSYAAKLRRHFKPEEIKQLLYETARPVEQFWSKTDGAYGQKYYYKYVADLSKVYYASLDLAEYANKMGHGQVDAYAFLKRIEGAGVEMTFPNVFVAEGCRTTVSPAMYFENGASQTYQVTITDETVAAYEADGNKLVFIGLNSGQTAAKITASGGESFDFVITVRKGSTGAGWL